MTDFMDPTVGNQRRQQLLQFLMQQSAGLSGAASGIGASMAPTPSLGISAAGARGGFGNANPFFGHGHTREAGPNFTNAPSLSPGLIARLGPGAYGRNNAAEHSSGFGLPVDGPAKLLPTIHHQGLPGAPLPVGAPASPAAAAPMAATPMAAAAPAAAPLSSPSAISTMPPSTPISVLPLAPAVQSQPVGGLPSGGLTPGQLAAIAAIKASLFGTAAPSSPIGPTAGAAAQISRIGY